MAARRVVAFPTENNGLTCPTGAKTPFENIGEIRPKSNGKPRPEIAPAHKAIARELGYALTLCRNYGWQSFTDLAATRLSDTERAALAFAALQSLSPKLAELTAAHALGASGCPLPPFLGGMDEARLWAACATTAERKALALAAFEALAPRDRAAFLNHVTQKELAA